jgi:predicted phosphoribosyltransferase
MFFRDRTEAGRELAKLLVEYRNRLDVLVLALPRGGVPVAFEVAQALHLPLDVFLVRKLGVPGHEELAMGAIASGGVLVLNEDVVRRLDIPEELIERVAIRERQELHRREQAYRGDRPPLDVSSRTIILIDDGLATGSSLRAAIAALRRSRPAKIIVAVPVGAADTCAELNQEADEAICAQMPEPFGGVGLWYDEFRQTSDDEVRDLLSRAQREWDGAGMAAARNRNF